MKRLARASLFLLPAHLERIVLELTCEVYIGWVNPELVTVDSLLHSLSICCGLNDSVSTYQLPVLQDTVFCVLIV